MAQIDDFKWYRQHQNELLKKHNGRVLAIKDGNVLGAYENELDAITETSKKFEVGTFIIQRCTPGTDAYTATFRTRVRFA